jgi:hypothetical protein
MNERRHSERGFIPTGAAVILAIIALVLVVVFLGRPLRRLVRESLMQRVTSAHYEILCPAGALSQETMREFAAQREDLFTELDRKLGDADSNAEIQIIFNTDFIPVVTASTAQPFAVSGTTIRTKLDGRTPELDSAADAEALLQTAWGKRGNALTGRWTSLWLVGTWGGKELGVAAAEVEQRLGHQKVATLLGDVSNKLFSLQDRDVLGAAWISQIAEMGGVAEVRKVYSTKATIVTVDAVTNALATTPQEIERKWQMWMYAYLAGMGPMSHESAMPVDMPMRQ